VSDSIIYRAVCVARNKIGDVDDGSVTVAAATFDVQSSSIMRQYNASRRTDVPYMLWPLLSLVDSSVAGLRLR